MNIRLRGKSCGPNINIASRGGVRRGTIAPSLRALGSPMSRVDVALIAPADAMLKKQHLRLEKGTEIQGILGNRGKGELFSSRESPWRSYANALQSAVSLPSRSATSSDESQG
jgi:hypothetical protein